MYSAGFFLFPWLHHKQIHTYIHTSRVGFNWGEIRSDGIEWDVWLIEGRESEVVGEWMGRGERKEREGKMKAL